MRTILLTTMAIVFIFCCTNVIQAQTTKTELDQVELSKQYIGTWKMEKGKDTTYFFVTKSLKNGARATYTKGVSKGKIFYEDNSVTGYDKKSNKFLSAGISQDFPEINFNLSWFSSKNIVEVWSNVDLCHPKKTNRKSQIEFKSPDLFIHTYTKSNNETGTYTLTRVKN